jgi:CubicO group peptidase (beta-lactamase class C family)
MPLLPDLDARLAAAVAADDMPGVTVAVWHRGELATGTAGVLNLDTGVDVTPDSIFQIGSVTKLFTATLVLQLVEEGLVSLDAPVRTYLPWFAVADAEVSAAVTVRHLLTHTGGFAGDVFIDTGRGDDALTEYVRRLATAAQLHPLGEQWSYANSGYCVLGAIVETLCDQTWADAVRERILTPARLTETALYPDKALLFRASVGHRRAPGADQHSVIRTWPIEYGQAPAGSLMAGSARELIRFARMLMAGGVTPDGTRLLAESSVRAMFTPVAGPPARERLRWGLGGMVFDWDGGPLYGHDGNTTGQNTMLRFHRDHDFAIAVSGNGGDPTKLEPIVASIVTELVGVRAPARPVPPVPSSTLDVSRYVGRYAGPLFSYVVTVADEGGIDIAFEPDATARELGAEGGSYRWVHLADEAFVSAEAIDGRYGSFAFIDGGRYLYDRRLYPRVTP